MYSYGPPYMAGQKQDDQHEHIFSSYVRIRDVALKTCQRRWMIGKSGVRGSGISVLVARHDDDDDDDFKRKFDRFFWNTLYITNSIIIFFKEDLGSFLVHSVKQPFLNSAVYGRNTDSGDLKLLAILRLKFFLLSTQYYKVRAKWSNPGNGVTPSRTSRCSSY